MNKRRRVLIVDDEEGFCFMVKMNLEDTGLYDVRIETKGAQALEAARQYKPDFIFLDIVMPDMDGGDVAQEIKSEPSFKNVPIVFLTAVLNKDEAASRGGLIGGRPFVAKPAKIQDLIDCINEHLGPLQSRP